MKTQITKEELAKELYKLVSLFEGVSFETVYQKSYFIKENVLRYDGKANNYTTSKLPYYKQLRNERNGNHIRI